MKSVIFCRSAFNYDRDAVSDESGLLCLDPSLAQQSFKEEVDINTIVNRFGVTGHLPSPARLPSYGDFEGVWDYQSAMNALRSADSAFMALPAALRKRFDNDPHQFVQFCSDDANRDEAVKLGILANSPGASFTNPKPEVSSGQNDPLVGGNTNL